jgi:hypothetical protein
MSVLRRGAGSAHRSKIVLDEVSPYGSRRLVVETDGVASAAYVQDAKDVVVGAVWLANHQAAPEAFDRSRLDAGRTPVLPAEHVRHREGRGPLESLEAVWFEEGDGVALLEAGELLGVIPGWSDMERGVPGYSRDAAAQSPFAFPLAEEIEEFGPRIDHARRHWELCGTEGSWADFQQSVLGHLLHRLGPGGHYWHDVGRQLHNGQGPGSPMVGVSERPARGEREYTVLSTVGMSRQRMPTIELYEDDVAPYARIELAVATTLPSQRAGSIFPWLAQYPWRSVTWFAPGDVVRWYHEPRTFPLGNGEGVLLLGDPSLLNGPEAPELTGFTAGGDPVRWLWLIPITGEEHQYAKKEGADALTTRLANEGRSWIVA